MNSSVKFVYCDAGGVLFDEGGTNYFIGDYKLDAGKFRTERKKYLNDALSGKISADELITLTFKDMGLNLKVINYNDYWTLHSKPYLTGQNLLTIVAKYYPVGIITNNMGGSLAYYKNRKLIPNLKYKAIIQSSQLGVKKPDKEIYKIAEEECGFVGNSIFFIDDREPNLEGAENLGWQTFLFDRENQEASTKNILKFLGIDL